jgi:DNA-binding NarL/FixJ family response regulator
MVKNKILIADGYNCIRQKLTSFFNDETRYEIIGIAANGIEAIRKAEELKPDIIFLDLLTPQLNGLEVLKMMIRKNPETKIFVFYHNDEFEKIVAKSGAKGYLRNNISRNELFIVLEEVSYGEKYFTSSLQSFQKEKQFN